MSAALRAIVRELAPRGRWFSAAELRPLVERQRPCDRFSLSRTLADLKRLGEFESEGATSSTLWRVLDGNRPRTVGNTFRWEELVRAHAPRDRKFKPTEFLLQVRSLGYGRNEHLLRAALQRMVASGELSKSFEERPHYWFHGVVESPPSRPQMSVDLRINLVLTLASELGISNAALKEALG